jgi:hypothetical protein
MLYVTLHNHRRQLRIVDDDCVMKHYDLFHRWHYFLREKKYLKKLVNDLLRPFFPG